MGILGSSSLVENIDDPASLFSNKIPIEEAEGMVKKLSKEEIKEA